MSRSWLIALAAILFSNSLFADDAAIWREYGLAATQTLQSGRDRVTAYRMNDPTGAVATWEWLRTAKGHPCRLGSFCTEEPGRTVVAQENYVLTFDGPRPSPAAFQALFQKLPNRRDLALPTIINFVPRQGLVPDSARYVLGPASLQAFAPELAGTHPGFKEGAEAQIADYRTGKSGPPVHLALFDYPAPEMARLHMKAFQELPGTYVKRSTVLLGVVFGGATPQQAEAVLNRVQYSAKIVWDDVPPPSPVKPLVRLLLNIIYFCILMVALCTAAGLMYAGMRIYRRRYGTLEADEAMTTLHLSGDWKSACK
jgi:hypothetical protein